MMLLFTRTGVSGAVQPSSLTGAAAKTEFPVIPMTSAIHFRIFYTWLRHRRTTNANMCCTRFTSIILGPFYLLLLIFMSVCALS